MATNEETKLH